MKIACIGWGSLIWRPGGLEIQNYWFEDGPILPIEFTRISDNNRVTLIIDPKANPVRTLWALMTCPSLDKAKESLKQREGVDSIELIRSIGITDETTDTTSQIIKNWLKEKDLDFAIWTGLSYSRKTKQKRPSIASIISHLRDLEASQRRNAEEYIRKAPKQIDTEYRREIEIEFGWTPVD
jgi:hypothetical protein